MELSILDGDREHEHEHDGAQSESREMQVVCGSAWGIKFSSKRPMEQRGRVASGLEIRSASSFPAKDGTIIIRLEGQPLSC